MKINEDDVKMIFTQYKLDIDIILTERKFLGKKGNCRYCRNGSNVVKFKKEAHTLPELIGNKLLFSLDECDTCNEYFDKNLENDLANFLGIERTTTKIQGKRGIPKHKSKEGNRVEVVGGDILILESEDIPITHVIDENTIRLSSEKSKYTPIEVYKCFTKMALAILPDIDIDCHRFSETINWVRHNIEPLNYDNQILQMYSTFISGNNPLPAIRIMLFRRKSSSDSLPYMFCVIAFKNMMFQYVVPFSKKDRCLNPSKIILPYFPIPFSLPGQYGDSKIKKIDLTNKEPINERDFAYFFVKEEFKDISEDEIPEEIINRIKELGLQFKKSS